MNLGGKKVLVTGGGGFVGSHLVDKLLENNSDVTVVDLPSQEVEKNLAHVKDKIKFFAWDVTDFSGAEKLARDFDIVFHLAAYASPSLCEKNPDMAFKINVQGTYNVLRLASESNVKKFIFSSSAGIYGTYPKYVPIDENHPIEIANSVYNVTKRIGEDLCNSFAEKHNVPVTILRLFSTFGPRQSTAYFFPTLILQAIKKNKVELWSEKPTRDFNFVDNTVDAFIKAAEADNAWGPINIGSGREINVGEIARKVASDFGVEIKFLDKDIVGPMRLHCNNQRAREVLGWEPKISFEKGLKKTIEWYKNNSHLF